MFRRIVRAIFLAGLLTAVVFENPATAAEAPGLGPRGELVRIEFEAGGPTALIGRNARKQLLITGVYSSGQRHDR